MAFWRRVFDEVPAFSTELARNNAVSVLAATGYTYTGLTSRSWTIRFREHRQAAGAAQRARQPGDTGLVRRVLHRLLTHSRARLAGYAIVLAAVFGFTGLASEALEGETLHIDQAILLAAKVIEVNADFFTRTVIPKLDGLFGQVKLPPIVKAVAGSMPSST